MVKVTVHRKGEGRMFNEMNFYLSVLSTKSGDEDDVNEYNEIIEMDWKEDERGYTYLVVNRGEEFNVYYRGPFGEETQEYFGDGEGLIITTATKIREYRLNKLLDK
ncbi:MAG: hypothetical protein SLAVMIC_00693 [uncultured marine phage]|uniref:Uncharacterized protein n=1 Tax=uncultured marine phage TaxID=707152 RepID=A0A8D9C9C5_9VIRU|nr:MAG: hypothetical protein SLAVMIC_00693 [uncultured marine phage]